MTEQSALIVGAGQGLSASVARKCAERGMTVALAARDTAKLSDLSFASQAAAWFTSAAVLSLSLSNCSSRRTHRTECQRYSAELRKPGTSKTFKKT